MAIKLNSPPLAVVNRDDLKPRFVQSEYYKSDFDDVGPEYFIMTMIFICTVHIEFTLYL